MKEGYLKNKKLIAAIGIACIIFFGLVVTYWLRADRKADRANLNTEFAGSIEHVEYDVKQFLTVTIDDSRYYIGAGYNTDHQIEVGDSLIKKKGSEIYKLIKRRSNKIIEFKK